MEDLPDSKDNVFVDKHIDPHATVACPHRSNSHGTNVYRQAFMGKEKVSLFRCECMITAL